MLALSNNQLAAVMTTADKLPVEKRGTFLHRVVARLHLHGPCFTTTDFDNAVRLALSGLIQDAAA